MAEKFEFEGGIYEGEAQNGVPHGEGLWTLDGDHYYRGTFQNGKRHGAGYLRLDEDTRYEGSFQNGLMHGVGLHGHVCRRDMDGLDVRIVRISRGIWREGDLCGTVWRYFYEEDIGERAQEACVLRDRGGLELFGIDRAGKPVGLLAEKLAALDPEREVARLSWDTVNRCGWGRIRRDGKTYLGQIASEKTNPYFGYEYEPHGFCIEFEGERATYFGSFFRGARRGMGAVWAEAKEGTVEEYRMDYKEW